MTGQEGLDHYNRGFWLFGAWGRFAVLKKIILLSFFLFMGASCVHSQPHIVEPAALSGRIVIFVPGFMGSELVTRDSNTLRWLPWYLNIAGSGLSYVEPEEDGVVLEPPFVAAGLEFAKSHGVASIYQQIKAGEPGRGSVVPFTYDWRLSMSQNVQRLSDFVEGLHRYRHQNIVLVCHDTGGNLCGYYLRYGGQHPKQVDQNWFGAQRVKKVVFLGTPFMGTLSGLEDMMSGIRVGVNVFALSEDVLGTMPGAYARLPSPRSDFIVDSRRVNLTRSIYGGQNWLQYGWGFLAGAPRMNAEIRRSRYAEMKVSLEEAYLFSERLNAAPGPAARMQTRVLNVYGRGTSTATRLVWQADKGVFSSSTSAVTGDKPEELLREDGDGVIPVASAKLPKVFSLAFDVKEMPVEKKHDSLFSDEETRKAISAFVWAP